VPIGILGSRNPARRFGSPRGICNAGTVQLLDTPRERTQRRPVRWVSLPFAVITAWAVLGALSAVPIVINMINTPQQEHTVENAMRIGSVGWAVLFATPAQVDGTAVTLMPWGFALIAVGVFWATGRWLTRICAERWPLSGAVILGAALLTGVVGFVIGTFAELGAVSFRAVQVGAFSFAFSALGLGLGMATTLRDAQPPVVRGIIRGSVVAVFAMLGVSALLLMVGLLRNIASAQEVLESLQPETGPGFLITGLQIGFLPVFLVWSASYLTGAGFALGPLVSPFVHSAEPLALPPLPMLAAVPTEAPPAAWIFPVIVVIIGALGTVNALRKLAGPRWIGFVAGLGVALGGAAAMALLAVLSSGAIGTERLSDIGPTPSVVAWLTAALLFAGSLPIAALRARV
jgi:hypothetical protein